MAGAHLANVFTTKLPVDPRTLMTGLERTKFKTLHPLSAFRSQPLSPITRIGINGILCAAIFHYELKKSRTKAA
jgi:hypothetical protein